MPIGAKMYEAAGKDADAPASDTEKTSADDPVEGEVVDDKDKK